MKKNSAHAENETEQAEVPPFNRVSKACVPSVQPSDPFDDLASIRIDQTELNKGVTKKLLLTIPVHKPSKQHFFRVHPSPEYRLPATFIELKEERETYLVLPDVRVLLEETEYYYATAYLYMTRQGNVGIWTVKLPSADGRRSEWQISAAAAAEIAMKEWVRIVPNMSLGAYEVTQSASALTDPVWPDKPFNELLRIAFKGLVIDSEEHQVIQQLRGSV